MVIPKSFVVLDEIFCKISIAAASSLSDMDDNSSSTSPKMDQDQPLAVLSNVPIILDDLKNWADQMEMESSAPPPTSSAANGGVWENVNGHQRFSDWVASNLVLVATFKIKMALLNVVKLFCVEFASQESLNGATKVAIGNKVFLITLKIAWPSDVASVFFPFLSIALHNVLLGTSSDNIKFAFGIFGVVTSVKLKPIGLWQYVVVHFKDTSSAAAAVFTHWLVLVKKNSIRILSLVNQKEVITLRNAFKVKLVNLSFGCTVFEIIGGCTCFIPYSPECHHYYRCQDMDHLALECKVSPLFLFKVSFNFSNGPKVFKSSFAESKFYAKAVAIVVSFITAAANMNLDLGGSFKPTTFMLSVVSSALNIAVESKLASLKSHLGELFLLIKFLVEPVSALVVLVTKLLFTLPAIDVSIKESMAGLAEQNKGLAAVAIVMQKKIMCLEKKCEQACLENVLDNNNIDDNDNNNDKDKDFSVYNNTFEIIMHLWEDQLSSIKSNPDLTAK
ncbi:hypothetical protein G9A89_006943 [Geosiphon pyriformis]|nr:hypothetical protein G9A89_006943 [Geosiphon pyriformis]